MQSSWKLSPFSASSQKRLRAWVSPLGWVRHYFGLASTTLPAPGPPVHMSPVSGSRAFLRTVVRFGWWTKHARPYSPEECVEGEFSDFRLEGVFRSPDWPRSRNRGWRPCATAARPPAPGQALCQISAPRCADTPHPRNGRGRARRAPTRAWSILHLHCVPPARGRNPG
jgi:hypothetical protein